MPGRYIREGYNDSARVNSLEPMAERFYFRLFLVVDDYGRYEARPELLKAKCFGLRQEVRITDITRWIAACVTAGLILEYTVGGRHYIQLLDFRQQTRGPSKYPQPECLTMLNNAKQCSAMLSPNENEVVNGNDNDNEDDKSSGEASAASPPPSPVILEFPCTGRPEVWPLTQAKLDEYKQTFPYMDVLGECRKARQWEIDNPSRKKTFTGHPAFLGRWLTKVQNERGGTVPNGVASIRSKGKDASEIKAAQDELDRKRAEERKAAMARGEPYKPL